MSAAYGQNVSDEVRGARDDPTTVVLEGVHAVKHAVRFGASLSLVITPDRQRLRSLLDELAPDVALLLPRVVEVDDATWEVCAPYGLPSPALGLAARPTVTAKDVLAADGLLVLLEDPTHLGNLGACVRVAAAASAGGVLVVGDADPWHPVAVRGGAGLQFALPVAATPSLPRLGRPLIALDPEGESLFATPPPADAVLAFGTERHGLSDDLLGHADRRVSIPMRGGVSSLNLATAVAVACYARGTVEPAPSRPEQR